VCVCVCVKERKQAFTHMFSLVFNRPYSSPDFISVTISRRMGWTGRVAPMGDRNDAHRVMMGKPEGKNHLEDLDVEGKAV